MIKVTSKITMCFCLCSQVLFALDTEQSKDASYNNAAKNDTAPQDKHRAGWFARHIADNYQKAALTTQDLPEISSDDGKISNERQKLSNTLRNDTHLNHSIDQAIESSANHHKPQSEDASLVDNLLKDDGNASATTTTDNVSESDHSTDEQYSITIPITDVSSKSIAVKHHTITPANSDAEQDQAASPNDSESAKQDVLTSDNSTTSSEAPAAQDEAVTSDPIINYRPAHAAAPVSTDTPATAPNLKTQNEKIDETIPLQEPAQALPAAFLPEAPAPVATAAPIPASTTAPSAVATMAPTPEASTVTEKTGEHETISSEPITAHANTNNSYPMNTATPGDTLAPAAPAAAAAPAPTTEESNDHSTVSSEPISAHANLKNSYPVTTSAPENAALPAIAAPLAPTNIPATAVPNNNTAYPAAQPQPTPALPIQTSSLNEQHLSSPLLKSVTL